jgi:hypothetical protein
MAIMLSLKQLRSLVLIVILTVGASCSDSTNTFEAIGKQLSGSGVLVSEERETTAFTSVEASGPITTVISMGNTRQILVTADDNVIHRVKASVYGNTLHISLKEGEYHNIWIRVQVVVPHLSALTNTGTGTMKVSGLDSNGILKVTNSGNGTLILEGRGAELALVNEGAGSFNGFDFSAGLCTVQNLGAGSCELSCTDLLDGTNTGSGSIHYKGPATVTIDNTGSGGVFNAN